MHEPAAVNPLTKYQVLWVGDDGPARQELLKLQSRFDLDVINTSLSQLLETLSLKSYQLLVFCLSDNNFDEFLQVEAQLPSVQINPVSIVYANDLTSKNIVKLVNDLGIVNLVHDPSGLARTLENAIQDFKASREEYSALKKIKNQNVQLELLTKNLENLVVERTKKDYESSNQALNSLKRIQEILRFIKQVARGETIEEILSSVRKEFKKYHGLRPPMLLFAQSTSLLRVFYFQGKQFTERKIVVDDTKEFTQQSDKQKLRHHLSNLFGRPFGSVDWYNFEFQAKETESDKAVLICENSFSPDERNHFHEDTNEKWPIISLAIENLLLRENSQITARQWARTFNEMQDPIFIIDKAYRMTLANDQVTGISTNICYKDFAGRDTPCVNCPVEKAVETGQPQSGDIRCRGKIYRVHSFPIFLQGQSNVTHMVNQYVDMTQTRDLQGRVVQGEKMAAIGMLAGNVAHELNNPLTGIHSLATLLLEDIEPQSNTFKDLTEVKDAAKRCQQIIKDLLEFSDAGADQKLQVIDGNEMVKKTLPLLKMATRNHNTNVTLSDDPICVEINPQLLQQVIFNLVNNACQAMKDGGDLYITSQRDGDRVTISVRDTGPGIPQELKQVIFDPFFTTKKAGKGTGLGLSMSRSIIERFGGQLYLNMECEKGSEFIIELPLREN